MGVSVIILLICTWCVCKYVLCIRILPLVSCNLIGQLEVNK